MHVGSGQNSPRNVAALLDLRWKKSGQARSERMCRDREKGRERKGERDVQCIVIHLGAAVM